jgi:hypothetical protein
VCAPYGLRKTRPPQMADRQGRRQARQGWGQARQERKPTISFSRVREKLESVVSIAAARSGAPDDPFSFFFGKSNVYMRQYLICPWFHRTEKEKEKRRTEKSGVPGPCMLTGPLSKASCPFGPTDLSLSLSLGHGSKRLWISWLAAVAASHGRQKLCPPPMQMQLSFFFLDRREQRLVASCRSVRKNSLRTGVDTRTR